jgi:hypothetical protein
MIFRSDKTQKFKKKVQYILNDQHIYEFLIIAHVVEVNLRLSETNLVFEYKSSNINMFTTKILTLENRGNAPAEFQFMKFRSGTELFWMKPEMGVINSKEKMDITFYY